MANVPFTSYLPEVLPMVQGCADVIALNAIRNSVIEFCTGSLYWNEVQTPVTLDAADFPYPLDFPTGAQAIMALGISMDGQPLGTTTQDELDNKVLNWRASMGTPRVYFQYNPNEIGVYPAPATATTNVYTMRVALAPSRSADDAIDFIHAKHLETIAAGALARLLQIPGVPWTNEAQAAHFRSFFNTMMTQATVEVNRAYNRGPLKVMLRPTG